MENKIFIVFLNDNEYRIFYLKQGQTESDAWAVLDKVFALDKNTRDDIASYFFCSHFELPPIGFRNCLQVNKQTGELELNRQLVINEKLKHIRVIRNSLLEQTDIPYQVAVRRKDDAAVKYIERKSQFLRDLPTLTNFELIDKIDDIIKFNPFNNVLKIKVVNGGLGYNSFNPKIEVEKPNGKYFGFQPILEPVISDDKIQDIIIKYPGCAYENSPVITVSEPPNGQKAEIVAELDNIVTDL